MNSFVEAVLSLKWIILFYFLIFLFIYINRKRFEIHFKVFAMYKTKWGINFMDLLGRNFSKPIRVLGYVGIIVGFLGMIAVVFAIFVGLYSLIFVPDAPATISPVLPGVRIPGSSFFIPFWHGILAIFIVAVVHEFGHGVVARAHRVEIKSTGPFVMGPFFGAFVEPDEASLKKRPDVVQQSIFAAGPFFNLLLAGVVLLLFTSVMAPLLPRMFTPSGVTFASFVDGGPAAQAEISKDAVYVSANGRELKNADDFLSVFQKLKPGDSLELSDASGESYRIAVGANEKDKSKPFLGILGITDAYVEQGTFVFGVYMFILELLYFIFILSIGVGTANLLPVGPIDGGRMSLLLLKRAFGEERGNVVWAKLSIIFLFFLILLMTPIFKATFQAIF